MRFFIMKMGLLLFLLSYSIVLARVKYDGGDWYNDPSALPNLASEINKRTAVEISPDQVVVELDGPDLFDYPLIFLTGHGKIEFSNREVENLRNYLVRGGFLYADDDYGMDKHFRREIGKVFPGLEFEELPFAHPIYHSFYEFLCLPKIHKHNDKPPKGYGMFYQGRLVIFYTHETNISDGWADPWVHKDSPEKRDQALRFGTNILVYALNE
jgi:hypothetical protein